MKKNRQIATTTFKTPQKKRVLKLTEIVMGLPNMRIEIDNTV